MRIFAQSTAIRQFVQIMRVRKAECYNHYSKNVMPYNWWYVWVKLKEKISEQFMKSMKLIWIHEYDQNTIGTMTMAVVDFDQKKK